MNADAAPDLDNLPDLPDGPVEIVLAALGAVRKEAGESPMRITSLRVAMLADELLKRGVVFPTAQAAPDEGTPDARHGDPARRDAARWSAPDGWKAPPSYG